MSVDLSPFLHRMDAKIDKVAEDMVEIKITLARNTDSLEQHMRRTAALETIVELNKKAVEPVRADVASIFTVIYVTRWALSCSAIAGVGTALYKWLT